MRFVEVNSDTAPTLLDTSRIYSICSKNYPYSYDDYKWTIYCDTEDSNCAYRFAEFEASGDGETAWKIMTALARWLNLPESESCRHTIVRYDGADGVEEVK